MRPIDQLEGQGWFTAELERSLLDGRADIAVHSAKDLPSALAAGLTIAAYLPRADARDGVVSASGERLEELPRRCNGGNEQRTAGGTPRRPVSRGTPGGADSRQRRHAAAQARRRRSSTRSCSRARGSIASGSATASPNGSIPRVRSLAGAGRDRARGGDAAPPRQRACESADDNETRIAVTAERAVLSSLGGGCLLPLGAWARVEDGRLVLVAALVVDGAIRRAEATGASTIPKALGEMVAARLR